MRELLVLLTGSSAEELVSSSIELQKFLSSSDHLFKINFQDGAFAQFIVETNLCAEHLEMLLRTHGFDVGVTDESFKPQENCHDCQKLVA